MTSSEVKDGSRAMVKVGRNEIEVTVVEATEDGWKVKAAKSGREFSVRQIERMVEETTVSKTETVAAPRPAKNLSLLNAAAKVLEESDTPMTIREMLKAAVERGLWIPTAAKTPEQSLYSAVFREIKAKGEHSRFRKADKGTFVFAR